MDFHLKLHLGDFVDRQIFASNDWDESISRVLIRELAPGDTFIDIGANIGYFTLLGAQCVGPTGHVLSLEPNPSIYSRLCKNVALNAVTHVETLCLGASDQPGSATLHMESDGHSGAASLRRSPNTVNTTEIQLDTLDSILDSRNLPVPSLIKMDVEGAEYMALKGFKNLLMRSDGPALVIEVSEWSLSQMGHSAEELIGFLSDCGYRMTKISQTRLSKYGGEREYSQYDALFEKA